MATLTAQDVVRSGLSPVFTAADVAGDETANDQLVFVVVKNGDASAHTVTFASQAGTSQGRAPAPEVVSVPAGEERWCGPWLVTVWNTPEGVIQWTYDAVTNVSVAVVRFNSSS